MPENNNTKRVPWSVFIWIIGIITIVFGWVFVSMGQINGKVEITNNDMTSIKVMLAEVRNDVLWIKGTLIQGQSTINK